MPFAFFVQTFSHLGFIDKIGCCVNLHPEKSSGEKDLSSEFEAKASRTQPGFVAEFVDFLRHNKKWWITPILIVLLLFALLIVLTASPVAPFIYPFF